MARKLTISFKETSKDIELFSYLSSLEDKSAEVKRLIRLGIEEDNKKKKSL